MTKNVEFKYLTSDYCILTSCDRSKETGDHLNGLIAILGFIRDSLSMNPDATKVPVLEDISLFGYYSLISAVMYELEILVKRGVNLEVDWEKVQKMVCN